MTQRAADYSSETRYEAAPRAMRALVYHGAGQLAWEVKLRPASEAPTDAIVRMTTTAISDSDSRAVRGDEAGITPGRTVGRAGIGIVDELGAAVTGIALGDKVLISCITSCATCDACRAGMSSHCRTGGALLGRTIDGTQAEFVRIPHAATSLHVLPAAADEGALALFSDIFPIGFECGVLGGQIEPGDTVAIVGAGPVGLATLMAAQLHSPAELVVIDPVAHFREVALMLGATHVVDGPTPETAAVIRELTGGAGVSVAIEAAGNPDAFDVCQSIVGPGGRVAVIGGYGRSAALRVARLWSRNVTISTRLVDTVTTPRLLKLAFSGRLDPRALVTHRFPFHDALRAYDVLSDATGERALAVLLTAVESTSSSRPGNPPC